MYSLIMLTIIGIVLGVARPAIRERQDRILIEQSIEILNEINEKIYEIVFYGPPNSRYIEIIIKKGELNINAKEDIIYFNIESNYKYSELNENVKIGDINLLTTKKANGYNVEMKLKYDNLNITFEGKDQNKIFSAAPTPHRIYLKNNGIINGKTNIDFYTA